MKCPYCGGLVILDVTRGEYVCTSCATVVDVVYMPSRSMYANEPLSTGTDLDLAHAQTYTGEMSPKLPLLRRLEVINRKLRVGLHSDLKAVRCIYHVGHKLGLEEKHIETAVKMLNRILGKLRVRSDDSVNVTYYKAAAAALLYAVLVHNLPISARDIAQAFRELGHRVSVTDMLEILRLYLGRFYYHTRQRILAYVSYIAARCGLSEAERVRITQLAARLLNKLDNSKLVGKNPRTLAAALVAYCSSVLKLSLSIVDIANVLSVSPLTLREHVRRLQKMLETTVASCEVI